jgi:uncharacterized protein YeaO (DUF488 family)
VVPSTELRKWHGHDPARFDELTLGIRATLSGLSAPGFMWTLCSHAALEMP